LTCEFAGVFEELDWYQLLRSGLRQVGDRFAMALIGPTEVGPSGLFLADEPHAFEESGSRFGAMNPPKLTPPAKLAGTPVIAIRLRKDGASGWAFLEFFLLHVTCTVVISVWPKRSCA
jgi:hypothetical protein